MSKPPDRIEFRNICEREFNYLRDEYGFREVPMSDDPWDFSVRFESPRTIVAVVGRSFGHALDVYVWPAEVALGDGLEAGAFHVRSLLSQRQIRVPIASDGWLGFPVWLMSFFIPLRWFRRQHDQRLQIQFYAKALRDAAPDVLRGDWASSGQWVSEQVTVRRAAAHSEQQPVVATDLRVIGLGVSLLGLILAARKFGLQSFVTRLFTKPDLDVLSVLPTIVGGFVLVGVGIYNKRRQMSGRRNPQS